MPVRSFLLQGADADRPIQKEAYRLNETDSPFRDETLRAELESGLEQTCIVGHKESAVYLLE